MDICLARHITLTCSFSLFAIQIASFRLNGLAKREASFKLSKLVSMDDLPDSAPGAHKWAQNSIKFSAKNFVAQNCGALDETYKVGDLLGEGGFGEVYACTHIESGAERAVKIMEKHAYNDD